MDEVLEQIKQLGVKYKVGKIVLFGSRARGDHSPVSDYDIAVYSQGMSSVDQAYFWAEVEEINTLKKIDLLFINEDIDEEIVNNIKRDGVVIYD